MKTKIKVIVTGLFGTLLLFNGCVNQKENMQKRVIKKDEVVESFFLYDTTTGFPIVFELKRNRLGKLSCESNDWRAFENPVSFCETWKQKHQQ